MCRQFLNQIIQLQIPIEFIIVNSICIVNNGLSLDLYAIQLHVIEEIRKNMYPYLLNSLFIDNRIAPAIAVSVPSVHFTMFILLIYSLFLYQFFCDNRIQRLLFYKIQFFQVLYFICNSICISNSSFGFIIPSSIVRRPDFKEIIFSVDFFPKQQF